MLASAPGVSPPQQSAPPVARGSLLVRLLAVAHYLCVGIPPALAFLYVKYQIMTSEGYLVVARSLGKIERSGGSLADDRSSLFTAGEKLSFYRGDLLWIFLILPPAWLVLAHVLRWKHLRGGVFALCSLAVSLWLYAEVRSYWVLGRFLSLDLARDAIRFGAQSNHALKEYVGLRTLVKLLLVVAAVGVLTRWAVRKDRGPGHAPLTRRPMRIAAGLAYAGLLLLTLAAWVPWMRTTPYHTSILVTAVRAFFAGDEVDRGEFLALTPAELIGRYREMTGAPAPRTTREHWAVARDCDVLIFVFETGPARCVAADGDLTDLPNLARLRERAWVGARHHSTYPYTSRAVFSILSSWYPSSRRQDFSSDRSRRSFPGIMQSLKHAGYQTAAYATDAYTRETDDAMYETLGIERRVYTDDAVAELSAEKLPGCQQLARDEAALRRLKDDMAGWHRDDRRFAALFLPQIGHAPWVDVSPDGRYPDVIARGRAVMAYQDAWLGQLMKQLEQAGRLDKTLIIVTGDHGIRNRGEDPSFQGGMIDAYSFHVPLILYAPPALRSRRNIPWITSHIDLAPSVLDLLGVAGGRATEQGSPVWEERLRERATYFWAHHYLGADGYHRAGEFAMWDHIRAGVYINDRLHFEEKDWLGEDSPGFRRVTDHLGRMAALQETWPTLLDSLSFAETSR